MSYDLYGYGKVKKQFPWKTTIIVCALLIAAVIAVFGYFQSVYLSLRIFSKDIIKIGLIEYEGTAFGSAITGVKTIENDSQFLSQLQHDINMEDISFVHPKTTTSVLFIYFSDGEIMNGYVSENKIGLNYGQVWLNAEHLQEMFGSIQ